MMVKNWNQWKIESGAGAFSQALRLRAIDHQVSAMQAAQNAPAPQSVSARDKWRLSPR